jgi:5-oxoprolinase (ATP-hydrolysing) subunit A
VSARVWLNVDLGELPGEPEALYECAHVANVACGGHAGDDDSMRRAVDLCARWGTALGAHPSYADRDGFGRKRIPMTGDALRAMAREQCLRLARIAGERGRPVVYVKPHGALYHDANGDSEAAGALVCGVMEALGVGVTLIGPGTGTLGETAARAGLAYAREGFADRGTRADGTLVPRGEAGALLTDPSAAAKQAKAFASGGAFDTLCVHGDTPGAVAIARAVRDVLDSLAKE